MRTAIVDGTVLSGPDLTPVAKGVVLVEDDRITAVGPASQVGIPSGARIVRVPGCYVIPGLVDAHNHIGTPFSQAGMGEGGKLPSDTSATLTAVHNARVHLNSGVTTMRDCGERHFMDIEWRDSFARRYLDGPRLVVSGPGITATNGHGRELSVLADGPDAIRRVARENLRAGADWIKIFTTGSLATKGTVPTAAYYTEDEIRSAVEEAHRMGKPVGTHCHGGIAMTWSLRAGMDVFEHGTGMSDQNVAELAAAEKPLVVTLGVRFSEAPAPGAFDEMSEPTRRMFDSISRAHRAGIKIAAGGDTRHVPHTLVFELECLIKCGLSTKQALIAGTKNGAEVCGLGDVLGTLQPGTMADLVVVGSDPLGNIKALEDVRLVLKAGRVMFDGEETVQ